MIKNTEKLVYQILLNVPSTRKDDFILYAYVLYKNGIDLNMPTKTFFLNAEKMKAPAFETVSRCRRKIQEKYPELIDKETAEKRYNARLEFFDYSKGR